MDEHKFALFLHVYGDLQGNVNWQNNLRNDFQIAVHEHVERVRDDAFRGIFHGHDAVIRAVFGDLGKMSAMVFCDA